jgi:hypothetical protein
LDWIEQYLELTEGLPTPAVFRLWSGIFAVGACMERRTWLHTALGPTYPNGFMLLVGPPGSGKTVAMTPAKRLLLHAKCVNLASDDMTKAALLDEMAEHSRRILYKGETIVYHPLCIMVSEFGTLVNAHDLEFFSVLSDLFDNKDTPHRSRRRGHNAGKALELPRPNINILAGTQPGFLGSLLPPEAWQQGFTSRLLMVYAPGAPATDMFAETDDRSQLFAELAKGLSTRGKLVGQFRITEGAKEVMRLWQSAGMKPVPEHERLEHYRSRRAMHVLKLAMVAAASARGELEILDEDMERAKSWLLAAEHVMPDIFRDMTDKSDSLVLGELHRFAWELWVKSSAKAEQRKAIHRSMLMRFLALKVPADKALRVLEMAVLMQWLDQVPDTLMYVPKARGFSSDAAS